MTKLVLSPRPILFIAVLIAGWASAALAGSGIAVMFGGEADLDACGGYGEVVGLNPQGDGFLAVRSGPGSNYTEIDKIYNGQPVHFCDARKGWVGIVYSLDNRVDCRTGSPVARRQPYSGPCRSGWAFAKYLKMTAG